VIFFNFGEAVTRPLKEAEKAAGQTATSTGNTIGGNVAAAVEKTLSEKLNGIKLTPAQDYAQDLADFESYLNSMADMENLSGEARVAAIQAQERRILKAVTLTEAQRKGLAEASAAAQ
jgi:hypothetical protein